MNISESILFVINEGDVKGNSLYSNSSVFSLAKKLPTYEANLSLFSYFRKLNNIVSQKQNNNNLPKKKFLLKLISQTLIVMIFSMFYVS